MSAELATEDLAGAELAAVGLGTEAEEPVDPVKQAIADEIFRLFPSLFQACARACQNVGFPPKDGAEVLLQVAAVGCVSYGPNEVEEVWPWMLAQIELRALNIHVFVRIASGQHRRELEASRRRLEEASARAKGDACGAPEPSPGYRR